MQSSACLHIQIKGTTKGLTRQNTDLLILDNLGLQLFDSQARVNLLDIIEGRHGKRSTLIASQILVKEWYDIIG